MVNTKIYENLMQYQGRPLKDIDIHDVIDAVIEAGRGEDYENIPIEMKNDVDRISSQILSFDYINEDGAEFISVLTPSGGYEIPVRSHSGVIDYREIDNRVKNTIRNMGNINIYLDMRYLEELELSRLYEEEQSEIFSEDIFEKEITYKPELEPNIVEGIMEPEIIQRKRTQISSEMSIELKDVAERLRLQGYNVRTKRGGSLLVTDPNLSMENSITVTRKNAYIEVAELKTPETKALYDKMKNAVVDTMNSSLAMTQEKYNIIVASPRLSVLPAQIVTKDLLSALNTDRIDNHPDYADVFSAPKQKYSFRDKDGNNFLSISTGYTIIDNGKSGTEKDVAPVIIATYGPDYGGISKTFAVSEADLKACENDQLYKTDIAKAIDEFAGIADKDRESIYKQVTIESYCNELDKIFKNEFKKLDKAKAEYFAKTAKEYYRNELSNKDITFTLYMMKEMKHAPFYKESMMDEQGKNALKAMFRNLEEKLTPPDLSSLKLGNISSEEMSYTVERDGHTIFNSEFKEPIEYDREWINKLVRMQDKLMDLRNGPVQDMLDTAKAITKGVNEARKGIVTVYKDGIYSGLEFGTGFESVKEGLNYGHVLHNLEKEYIELAKSEKTQSQIAAINKKMDIKLYRDDIIRNANVYVKASITIRDKVDNMLDLLSGIKMQAEIGLKDCTNRLMNSQMLKVQEENFKKYGNSLVNSFKEIGHSLNEMYKGSLMIGTEKLNLGKDAINLLQAKSAMQINNFRSQYNDIVTDAKVILSSKEFTKDRIAERINDARIQQSFIGISSAEFNKIAQTRFWSELDATIQKGEALEKVSNEERSPEEDAAIRLGKQSRFQKEQNLFIAEQLSSKISDTVLKDDSMTPEKALSFLTEEYHKSAMAFNVMNGASSIKSFADLSDSEKAMCKSIVATTLSGMPNVMNKLEHNLEKNSVERNTPER